MSKIFITGSSDGLGLLAAKSLIDMGHEVVLHARNNERKKQLQTQLPLVKHILVADLSDIEETKALAKKVNELGKFDAIIHNAGIYQASSSDILKINVLAPYILTCLITKPNRLIYVSSDMHLSGEINLDQLSEKTPRLSYSDSKLLLLLLCKYVARNHPNILVNALHPGWVPTKMGGKGAPDYLKKGFETQVWLSVSDDKEALVSGQYFFHKKPSRYITEVNEIALQNKFILKCEELSGINFNHSTT